MNTPLPKVSPEDIARGKRLSRIAWIFSGLVFLLVLAMRSPYKIPVPWDTSILPPIHAVINALVAVALLFAYYFIKSGRVEAHRKSMLVALGLSVFFLLSYVMYHFTTVETSYCKDDWTRPVYFIILISHIVLAGVSLPFILLSFIHAMTHQYTRHRKMVRWVYPIWLYVALTGPIVYLMLRSCYT